MSALLNSDEIFPPMLAAKRGVKLRIVVPGQYIDSDAVRAASRATIAEYGPTMYHCKLLLVDGVRTSVGSTNFDNRSFRLNDEATRNIIDSAFARGSVNGWPQ